jgi:hypothetical protein
VSKGSLPRQTPLIGSDVLLIQLDGGVVFGRLPRN